MTSSTEQEIASLVSQYGSVPPPWVVLPEEHPYSMEWRLGAGRSHLMLWYRWWQEQNFDQPARIEYFRAWSPPALWLEWMITAIWDIDDPEEVDYSRYFEQIEALGFGSQADFEQAFDDPKWLQTS